VENAIICPHTYRGVYDHSIRSCVSLRPKSELPVRLVGPLSYSRVVLSATFILMKPHDPRSLFRTLSILGERTSEALYLLIGQPFCSAMIKGFVGRDASEDAPRLTRLASHLNTQFFPAAQVVP